MMKFINSLADYNNSDSLGNRFRNKRFEFFEEQMQKLNFDRPIKILDIGGTESYWVNRGYRENQDYHITILNLAAEKTHASNMVGVKGDACNLSEFRDNEFDLVFSNSVIEHLYNFKNKKAMASEVQRVDKNYFVQTPNKFFLIENHYILPFFQFLPMKVKIFILTKTTWSRGIKRPLEYVKRELSEIRLLSKQEMKQLFPNGKIYEEKYFFMNKSFTSYSISN